MSEHVNLDLRTPEGREAARALGYQVPGENLPEGRRGEEGPRTAAGGTDPFVLACRAHGLPDPVPEFPFAILDGRRWRFDWAWVRQKVALECQGGLFVGGRHVRGAALLKEYEKLNAAAVRGWRVVFCSPQQLRSGEIFATLKEVLQNA